MALHELYRAAGKPSVRRISEAIRDRDDFRDTVSHETISAMLRGSGLPRWVKVDCVVRQLAALAVTEIDPDEQVRRFHRLWLAASDALTPGSALLPRAVSRDFVTPVEKPADVLPPKLSSLPMINSRPARNADFAGRASLLADMRAALKDSTVVLYGFGGVGKTQLAVEYSYRWAEQYDLVWWIPAEQPVQATAALTALGERLGLGEAADTRTTARAVLDFLETSALRWLLVYDNADSPADVAAALPSAGGHAIVTSRNADWATVGTMIEIGVFSRRESVEFLRGRSTTGSADDVDRLAERLGDLPLALDQVSAMHVATGMPIAEYLRLFAEHFDELLSAGRPAASLTNVTTFVMIAFGRLQTEMPAAAQLLQLLAFMAPEPVSFSLLRIGIGVDVSPPLSHVLRRPGSIGRIANQMVRYGLARIEPDGPRIQVHRLIQLVLRESAGKEAAQRIRRDVHRMLAAANPGKPDSPQTWGLHAELGPHLVASEAIKSAEHATREAVLDQIRYLERVGNFEASADLAGSAVGLWSLSARDGGLGGDHEDTILATRHLANARRALGDYSRSREMIMDLLERLRSSTRYGEDHPHTLETAVVASFYLRMAGDYEQALTLDEDQVRRRRRLYGSRDPRTLVTMNNMTVNLRLLGRVDEALVIDDDLVRVLSEVVGRDDPATLVAVRNVARDLLDLGRYAEAAERQRAVLPVMREQGFARQDQIVVGTQTVAVALRKMGNRAEALSMAAQNYQDCQNRFGPDHEHTLSATMTYANTLRTVGDAVGARSLATEALHRYRQVFGEQNPLTLAASTNYAVILRAAGSRREPYGVDEVTLNEMRRVLGPEHPYTLATAVGLANDLAHAGDHEAAAALGGRTLEAYRRVRTDTHPETWACAANLALDTGAGALAMEARENLERLLGSAHPDCRAAAAGERLECDIEPPPT